MKSWTTDSIRGTRSDLGPKIGKPISYEGEIVEMVEWVPIKRKVPSSKKGSFFSLIEKNNFYDESCTGFELPC